MTLSEWKRENPEAYEDLWRAAKGLNESHQSSADGRGLLAMVRLEEARATFPNNREAAADRAGFADPQHADRVTSYPISRGRDIYSILQSHATPAPLSAQQFARLTGRSLRVIRKLLHIAVERKYLKEVPELGRHPVHYVSTGTWVRVPTPQTEREMKDHVAGVKADAAYARHESSVTRRLTDEQFEAVRREALDPQDKESVPPLPMTELAGKVEKDTLARTSNPDLNSRVILLFGPRAAGGQFVRAVERCGYDYLANQSAVLRSVLFATDARGWREFRLGFQKMVDEVADLIDAIIARYPAAEGVEVHQFTLRIACGRLADTAAEVLS